MEDVLEFALILDELRSRNLSLNLAPNCRDLTLMPSVNDEYLIGQIIYFFSTFLGTLPGFCDHCGEWRTKRTASYWGARPHYCTECLKFAVDLLDRKDRWPDVVIPPTVPAL